MNNEELQSRREFFKKAAKAALPVVAVAMLANLPISEAKATSNCLGCQIMCSKDCTGHCQGGCRYGCKGNCKSNNKY